MAYGWLVHAERAARSDKGWRTPIKGNAGWPDLALSRGPEFIVCELKRKPYRLTNEQIIWLNGLAQSVETHLAYVPEEQDLFIRRLASPSTHQELKNDKYPTLWPR